MAQGFFPDNYKTFPFKEGDLLASESADGRYSINKVLRIDKVILKEGNSINIQGQIFEASSEDFLLIVSMSYGDNEFDSLDEAKSAANLGSWTVKMGHIPNRPPGAAMGQTLIGHQTVSEDELVGYKHWLEAFKSGQAGVY